MALNTYSSEEVLVIVGGVPVTGAADGDFCKVSFDEDAYKKVVGADGQASRARNANQGGTVEITLQSTSLSNDFLSTLAEADRLLGIGVVPLLVKDGSGTTVFSAQNAWVKKPADVNFSKEQNTRVWVLDCDRLVGHAGGNA